MKDCVFCKILKGEVPSDKVYEDKQTYAFLDINPVSEGHTLVIPKKHFETMDEMDEKTANAVIKTTQKIGKAILKLNGGYNIIQNNKFIAGQIVPHVHYHLVPRKKGDNIRLDLGKIRLSKEEFEVTRRKIKEIL